LSDVRNALACRDLFKGRDGFQHELGLSLDKLKHIEH
jgi:hypothetical protein